jgi:hypothetical protein
MKFTLEISPEEFKQLIGADKLEKAFHEQMSLVTPVTSVWSQVWLDWMKEHVQGKEAK